ncbi:zinc-binding dehydrogenase [Mastigocoleus testarum]|uniref:Enoyl reductase (ER) domain-containing protein n=1 Tax=Mastigocoleus testarum BC008 TaxID=371196 RepID=A0A0V7ZX96_9CYAN|nr:zinc-binding dehydrogenase [Mastigocoleus testarum]KST63708.1 hypothetical protein BC008_14715 [Mastigocoleus testarum BC008]KST69228.1 hypothetical protein BC008_03300 [Mastigocoleus testarum BC008]
MRKLIGSPNATGGLEFTEAQIPKSLPNECLVRVTTFSMNRGEISFAQRNEYAGKSIGWDVAGTIEEAAIDGSGPQVGTKVVGFCTRMDGWAEYVAIPSNFLAPIPDGVSDDVAATLPVAALTALHCLEKGTRLLGSKVLCTGATGGVGLFAIQLAKLMGAEVIAQVRKPEQVDFVSSFGADNVIITSNGEAAKQFAPYRLIVDGVGGELLGNLTKFVAKGGTIVTYGSTGGDETTLSTSSMHMNGGQHTLYGLALYTEVEFETASSGLTRLLKLVEQGKLKTHIGREGTWEEAGKIAAEFLQRKFTGKAVIRVLDSK